jgi:predicted signal transduction protein with EAL and GGDEF domain
MTDSAQAGAIVRAILELATTLSIDSLAEGVETAAQMSELAAFGCNEVQGILLCAPQPAEAVPRLLADWRATDWTAAITPYRPATIRLPLRSMKGAADRAAQ